jgi:polyhydroxyalkanoate synthesis repressor PhaR
MAATKKQDPQEATIIKKYANRRLYNTETSVYITLEDVRQMVKAKDAFVVVDAKSGEDLTRQILTQIIYEQEQGDASLLSTGFLRRIIEMYDQNVGDVMPAYLESSMETFSANQEKITSVIGDAFKATTKGANPMTQMEEMAKQNMELMNNTMQMFNPMAAFFGTGKK